MVAGKTNTDDVLKLLKTPNKSRQKLEDFKVCVFVCVCEEQIALSCLSLEKILIYIYTATNGSASKKQETAAGEAGKTKART